MSARILPFRASLANLIDSEPLIDLPECGAERLFDRYCAATRELSAKWPRAGVEDLRKVVAAYDAFAAAFAHEAAHG